MTKKRIGAALSLVFIAAVVSVFALHINLFAVVLYVAMSLGMIGSTVTYCDPVIGVTAPTQAQASAAQSVTATVNWSDGDTTAAVITHNWQLTNAQLAKLRPWVRATVVGGMTVLPGLVWALGTNTVTVTKSSSAGSSGGTLNVVLERPWSPLSTIDAH
jgi:hypothetical protein